MRASMLVVWACVFPLSGLVGCDGGGGETGGGGTGGGGTGGATTQGGGGAGGAGGGTSASGGSGAQGGGGQSQGGQGGTGGSPDPCAACPDSCCNGTCTDLTTTSQHCGACGHSCEGGACQNSTCAPVNIAGGSLVGIDDDEVFIIVGGQALGYPKAGGAPATIGAISGARYSLTTNSICATTDGNSGSVFRLDLTTGETTTIATSENNPTYALEVGGNVYWGTTGGVVRKAGVGGGAPTNFITGQQIPYELKTDGVRLYFTDTLSQQLKRYKLDGSPGVADAVPSAFRMALKDSYIYLTGNEKIYVTQADGFGGGISTAQFLPSGTIINCVGVDGGATLTGTTKGLYRTDELIVPGATVTEVAADDQRIYFQQAGVVYKLVK